MQLIDAEPVKKFIVDGLNNKEPNKAFGHDAIEILAEIEYAPTIEATPVVHGRWEKCWEEKSRHYFRCSNCKTAYMDGVSGAIAPEYGSRAWRYCPNCGAKMDGDESERC